MCALVSLPENCGTNPGWVDWSFSTETPTPGLFSAYFLMDSNLLPFFLHYIQLSVTNMNYSQRNTSYFNYINSDGRNPSFASLNMDLVWMWDKFSCQDLNSRCKFDRTTGNMMLSIFCVWYYLIHLYSPLSKF